MVSRAVGVRARTALWPLVALLTLLGFAWMHVVAVTDPGTAQHHRVPTSVTGAPPAAAPAPAPGDRSPHGPGVGSSPHGSVADGHAAASVGHLMGSDGPGVSPDGRGDGSAGHGDGTDGHAVMVGCLLALTGVAAWALRRRPSAVRSALAHRRGRAARRGPAASWPVPARGCGPPRIALCVLRV